MKIDLIAIDIDGTLTNDQKEITPVTLDALMAVQRKGVRLALASARPAPGLFRMRDILHMSDFGGLLMSYNGGRIVDAASGDTLSQTSMDRETTRILLRELEKLPVTVILDDGKRFYVTDRQGFKVDYECRNNQMTCEEVSNLADFLHFDPVKLLLSVDPAIIYDVQKTIAALLPDELTVVRTAPFYLEIIPRIIDKGKGLAAICEALGIDMACTAAFGDSENDIPMIKAAGAGVAMGNAEEAVRQAADYVTASNNEDGIAKALEKMMGE